MRSLLTILVLAALLIPVVPSVFAAQVGGGVTPDIQTEHFEPLVWLCDDRVISDDSLAPGRLSGPGGVLLERINNYAFEGERIRWTALVMDKNGIDKVADVYVTLGDSQGTDNDIEVNCQRAGYKGRDMFDSCNARILEERVQWDDNLMDFYECILTVETADSMDGKYFVTIEAEDRDGELGTMVENEYWYFNPMISLSITGDMIFENVRPGTSAYSSTILVGNDAERESGVMMDMFISGTDFYDSSSSGAMCPTSNVLELSNFRYYATNGAYSTRTDAQVDMAGSITRNRDVEGYVNIEYGSAFNNPAPFYDNAEILQAQPIGPYWMANLLAPGAQMAVTFRLDLPAPCNGDFDAGSIFFWGEAV